MVRNNQKLSGGIVEIIFFDKNQLRHFYTIDCHAEQNHLKWDYHKSKKDSTSKAHKFIEPVIICGAIETNEISNPVEGDILEFGCYTGISSSKLSITAKNTNKKLYVFDSFEGLPELDENASDNHKKMYEKGQYCCSFDTVKNNIKTYGCIENVELVKGYFQNSLKNFESVKKIAYAFVDVDLVQSLEECLEFILPKLQKNSILFSHEATDPDYLPIFQKYGLMNSNNFFSVGVGNGINNTDICFFKKL